MAIKSLKLNNVGPFRRRPDGTGDDGIKLEFDANVNLFIGPNNVGKSTMLQTLSAIVHRDGGGEALPDAFKKALLDEFDGDSGTHPGLTIEWSSPIGDYRKLTTFIGAVSGVMGDFYEVATLEIGDPDKLEEAKYFGFEEGSDLEALRKEFGYVGHHNPDPATEWTEPKCVIERNVLTEIIKVILEITEGFRVEVGNGVFVDNPESGQCEWRAGKNKFATMDGALTFPELSHGTRSVFAWVSQFMLGMAQHYQDDERWKQRRGIFIIDEIDAHLHPSWQRRIIPTLQRHFPNVQIFASTHSPMMVAGLKKGQVHLLKRDETGQVVWSRNEQDIIGWTADEIYRTFMGIDDPTDELTVQRANRLRELRRKESLAPEEEREMDELRRQVNEDLLAKGRINAQRERYAGLMEQFLRSRMTDLSQDGV